MRDEPALDADALTAAHIAVENVLIEMRDGRVSVMGPANGFVVREPDGALSDVIRLGTRDGLAIGIMAYLAATAEVGALDTEVTDRPLGIHDLFLDGDLEAPTVHEWPSCWYWCRRHTRAEHVDRAMDGCVRVGPFMSQREAERLSGNQPAGYGAWALGMDPEADSPAESTAAVAAEGPRDPLLKSEPRSPSVLQISADLAHQTEGRRLCGLGYHAWMPWVAIWVGDPLYLSRYETYCVRCHREEQFDV